MSDFAQFDLFNSTSHNKKQYQHGVDFCSTDEPIAPTSDEFDSELDALFEGIDFDLLPKTVDTPNPQAFQIRQADTFNYGPASAFTFSSSESSYDSRSIHSESCYSYSPRETSSAYSPRDTSSTYSVGNDLDAEFQKFVVDPFSSQSSLSGLDCIDPTAFSRATPSYRDRSSFSDYGPSNGLPTNYFNQLVNYGAIAAAASASVDQLNTQPPIVPSIPLVPFSGDTHMLTGNNPRRKYKCTVCPRAFDRAFNLKTHMETHNPNRLKPYVCPHESCRRAFSRKHDLGRHMTSIHRDDAKSAKKAIGVGKSTRTWCESCGKGLFGDHISCDCNESERPK